MAHHGRKMHTAGDLIHRRDVVPMTAFASSYSRDNALFDPLPNSYGAMGLDKRQAIIEVIETNAKSGSCQRLFLTRLSLIRGV
jgi:hypothetical protein